MAQYCLFDLDGTLTDSGLGITGSAQYALRQIGIDVPNRSDLNFCVGPPLLEVLTGHFGVDPETAEFAYKAYRAHYREYGLFENEVYPGIPELLETLKARGKTLVVATSKPTEVARIILEHFGLLQYFDAVYGSEPPVRYAKPDVLRYAMEMMNAEDLSEIMMIGDRKYDVEGARAVGVQCIGVTYGYGSREELIEAGADIVVDTPAEVADYV
ncbi:MAG: HAD-IA family hydrolase [Lachnospiraceae bacterium]|nr:HAD-IA family hydrolase [Lachnospiraceae bacterium]MBR5739044.1 HAD-IA family hydrolase [Lachnospiraceae bacterium]